MMPAIKPHESVDFFAINIDRVGIAFPVNPLGLPQYQQSPMPESHARNRGPDIELKRMSSLGP